MRLVLICCLATTLTSLSAASRKEDALITNLPGLTFDPGFKQYSGYLHAGSNNAANFHFFFWFVEAQVSAETAPLVLWLNGGPGCSSLFGFLDELGPFHVNADASTLFENPNAWNKVANILFIESPQGVGFSYASDFNDSSLANSDSHVAEQNYLALLDFFTIFPEYVGREFFITGESYAGVYIPTLTLRVLRGIAGGQFPNNLTGIAIGNGCMDRKLLQNSLVDFMYYHGFVSTDKWDQMKEACCNNSQIYPTECNYYEHLKLASNCCYYVSDNTTCGNLSYAATYAITAMPNIDRLNAYQACYMKRFFVKKLLHSTAAQQSDGARNTNYDSTDAQGGYRCFEARATYRYLNSAAVQHALHISTAWRNHSKLWHDCIEFNYTSEHDSMAAVFDAILNGSWPRPRILIYNGDVDTVCNYLGDEWFVDALTARNGFTASSKYGPWYHREQIAGFDKSFTDSMGSTIDFCTVKGSGHFVPLDRPGPALQMIVNFIRNTRNYSRADGVDTQPKPPLASTTPAPSRKQADQIHSLPGLSFQLNFRQYSGYLNAGRNSSTGATYHLHYWLVQSQHSDSDPLVLWLNGGPGCSSMFGLFNELGPYYPNKAGDSLYENVFSWNKIANVLFLESPNGVGFSYATDWSIEPTGDDLTAQKNYNALKDFMTIFPEYSQRDFYITGESYAGMYIPWLTVTILNGIEAADFPNRQFKGIAIGNGVFSDQLKSNSLVNFMYYHGLVGTSLWQELQRLCCPGVHPDKCDYFRHLKPCKVGGMTDCYLSDNTACGNATFETSWFIRLSLLNDPYNMYQSCYRKKTQMLAYKALLRTQKLDSTDALNGLPCWGDAALTHYLNQPDVQAAIHVSREWQAHISKWKDCNDDVYNNFYGVLQDASPLFDEILRWREKASPLRILIYNGDVDTDSNFLGAAWFIERLAANHSTTMARQERIHWLYRGQVAGYVQSYTGRSPVDVLTVKGAGHLVPLDRAGPTLQLIANFIWNTTDYSKTTHIDTHPKPLIQVKSSCPTKMPPTAAANRIYASHFYRVALTIGLLLAFSC